MKEYEEEQVQKQSFWAPHTPAKPVSGRSRNFYVRRRTLKNNLGDNSSLITDSQMELEASAPSHSEESNNFDTPIDNCTGIGETNLGSVVLFDLNKCLWELDDEIGIKGYVYIGCEDAKSRAFLDAKLAAGKVAKSDDEVLTFAEEEPFYFPSENPTQRGSLDKMRTCFSPVENSHVGAEKLQKPMGGAVIPDSLSQYDTNSQETVKPDHVVNHTVNKDQKFRSAYCIGGSALGKISSLLKKNNILKRKPDGGTDLNKRPQKRLKKRGYRPRVVGIGRPRKNFEPNTPKKSSSKTTKPTTSMRYSVKKIMSVKKSLSNHGNSVHREVIVDKPDALVSDTTTRNIDLNNQAKDDSAILLPTPSRNLEIGRRKAQNRSLDSNVMDYIVAIDTEVDYSKGNCINQTDWQYNVSPVEQREPVVNGMNFPKTCKKQRMLRRRWKADRWSVIASKFCEKARQVTLGRAKKKSAPKSCQTRVLKKTIYLTDALQSLFNTKKKRSKRQTRARNLAGSTFSSVRGQFLGASLRETFSERQEIQDFQKHDPNRATLFANTGGMVTDKQTDIGRPLINLDPDTGENKGSPSEHANPCFRNVRDPLEQHAQIPSRDHGILVPYPVQQDQNTQSPYTGHGMLVTYKGKLGKRWEKLTDQERQLVLSWKFQMQCTVNECQRNEGDEEWWANERKVFHARIQLLISRMHVIQGNRKFSPWKGSVVDSVVGVFLTQNVSDHLSSSAFMTLAARFPCQSSFNETDCEDLNIGGSQESIGSNIMSILPLSDEELHASEATNLVEYGNIKSGSDKPNELNGVSRSPSNSYKPPEVSKIPFHEKMDQLEILEDNVGSSCMVPDCSSQTKVERETQNNETHLCSTSMPSMLLDNPERTLNTVMENPEICVQPSLDSQVEQTAKELNLKDQQSHIETGEAKTTTGRRKKDKAIINAKTDWDFVRKIYSSSGERNVNHFDSINWEAVRHAHVDDVAKAIIGRGQHNQLAGRIKKFLDQVHEDHKKIDLEWLRNAPPELVSKYLREIDGIGLKSLECVRLLTLQHVAFPVDVNVGRIAIRLGWVPLQPLPETLQMHVLQEMPVLDNVQKYLWPRLQTLDPLTLYELHYQMITFGKVYCTKRSPNCKFCPMKDNCRYYASAFASANHALPRAGKKATSDRGKKSAPDTGKIPTSQSFLEAPPIMAFERLNLISQSFVEANPESKCQTNSCEPIIEEPSSPEPECTEIPDIEDFFLDDPDCIPTLNMGAVQLPTETYLGRPEEVHMSSELVLSQAANIPAPKLKNCERLRTRRLVYVIPDYHPLLAELELERRDPDDPSPYLLAIWTSAETANFSLPLPNGCNSRDCNGEERCLSCTEQASNTVHGTILIPCRTATKGSFPLNGTYFQVNEVFCDHESSIHPINVPRSWIWNLDRRVAYFGTSTSAILKGVPSEEKSFCFWKGFICLRAFHRKTRTPQPLSNKFHISTVVKKTKKAKENEDE